MFFLKIILCSQTDTHDRSHYYYSTRCRTIKTARHRVGGHGDWRRRLSHWSGHLPRCAGRHGDVLPPVNVSQPIRIRRRDLTCSGEKGSDKKQFGMECSSAGCGRFLPREVRSLLSSDVRLSVCPSVTFVYYIQTAKDIVKFHHNRGSPIILVSWRRPVLPNSKGNPLSGGGVKYIGVRKNCNFRLKSPFISETVRDRPIVAIER